MKVTRKKLLNYVAKCRLVDVVTIANHFNLSTSRSNAILKEAFDAGYLVRHLINVGHARKTFEYATKESGAKTWLA